jgi:hypothetical protein
MWGRACNDAAVSLEGILNDEESDSELHLDFRLAPRR